MGVFIAAGWLSLVGASEGYSLLWYAGFLLWGLLSCCRVWALGTWASVIAPCELSNCGSWALECGLGSCGIRAQLLCDMWDLPWAGIELVSLHYRVNCYPLDHQGNSVYHIFIHSSVDGHLDCFSVLTVVNSAAVSIGVHMSFFKIYLFFNWRIIAYRILLFSFKPQHESAIGIHKSPPSWTFLQSPFPSHPSTLIQSPCLSSLRHTANTHWLSVLHMAI